jgi:uncharacterized protein YndB with AHSA1/START domain
VEIRVPIERVYSYVTTPANWPVWHVNSIAVSGATDHSLQPGEQVTEEFRIAGRRGLVTWTVQERVEPHHWVLSGKVAGGGVGTITYTLVAGDGVTGCAREFAYEMPNPLLALLDRIVIRRRIAADAGQAVHRLKEVLEAGEPG